MYAAADRDLKPQNNSEQINGEIDKSGIVNRTVDRKSRKVQKI